MKSKFGIYSFSSGKSNLILISEKKYHDIINARLNLVKALIIEEKFNLLIENYLEFEKELTNITFDKMLFPNHILDWLISVNDIHLINRRLINLLTTSRLYIDQIKHDISSLYDENLELLEKIKTKISSEYDSKLGYRALEALRNYVQHRSLPVHLLSYTTENVDKTSNIQIKNVINPKINISELEDDTKFKKSVLKELKLLGKQIDLKLLIREYIQSLENIHIFIRELLHNDISRWDKCIDNVYKKFEKQYGQSNKISIIELGETIIPKNRTYILKEVI